MNSETIQSIAKELHQEQVKYSKLNWALFTTGDDFGVKDQYHNIMEILKDQSKFEAIDTYKRKDLPAEEARKAEIMYNSFKPFHLSDELNELNVKIQEKTNELSKILNTFRYKLDGKEVSAVELSQVLSMDPDREKRKRAYFARNQINELMVESGFVELVQLRKEFAEKYGAKDYVAYKLEANELNPDTFDSWLDELHELLPKMKEGRQKYAQKFLGESEIMPWDESYIQSKIAPSLNQTVDMSEYHEHLTELFNRFGIDLAGMNITYDIFPRNNKSEWGYNFPVETGKDSRILANVKNRYYEYGVLLHESGHGAHSFLNDPNELILNNGISGIVSEGIANLFQSFLYSRSFFEKFFEDPDQAEQEFQELKEYSKLNALRSIGRIFFDHSLYKNDIQSLDDIYELYWKNHKEVLQEDPFGEAPPWAFIIHFTTHPIYMHNYFMGDVTCEMLKQVFKERTGGEIMDYPKAFGEFLLNEVIKPSGRYKYNELFKRISGEEFSLRFMID
ncbi:peptidase M3A and M3B thimet/oligopeptidase F [Halalkalibacillus sediminis]|uniref:Peptidase M3A and M3B thimet/oligopeptidase F n=1 Tax=Halalkalibacillus sediminis TaxID=2018042 RepID=A0A2I0QUS5_9BACI|nr:M3 family metallopeptidase [Halalkalibacillus sediminis]PKR78049.1 peptidase M3A and M3B thimet/oligopeptidase F [Halalkalibacillus sediminis]